MLLVVFMIQPLFNHCSKSCSPLLCFPLTTAWRELCVRRVQSTSLATRQTDADTDWSTEGTADADGWSDADAA